MTEWSGALVMGGHGFVGSIWCGLVRLLTCLAVFCIVPSSHTCCCACLLLNALTVFVLLRCSQWEATYFDVTHSSTVDCAKAAAQAGIEMIVIDDGYVRRRAGAFVLQQTA